LSVPFNGSADASGVGGCRRFWATPRKTRIAEEIVLDMKKVLVCSALAFLLAMGGQAFAAICTIDDVPAATLLLPYFEVDLSHVGDGGGQTTLFSINNASAAAAIAHVTVWTDWSIPTLDFDVYLTGYDVQTINVRDLFNGIVPRTADRGADAGDAFSPSPPPGATQATAVNPFTGPFTPGVPTEFDFASSAGPCSAPYASPVLDSGRIAQLRLAHTGHNASSYGGCVGHDHGDNIARGYITVDSVTQCNLLFPSSPGYFAPGIGIADTRNILWGDYFYINTSENFANGETLVHIESCGVPPTVLGPSQTVGSTVGGAGRNADCPFPLGEYTFYGRYAAVAGQDQREPLATTFAARYLNGGPFDGGTSFIVWRDSKTVPTGINGAQDCGDAPAWFPLNQTDVVGFDEQENPEDLCTTTSDVSPPPTSQPTCFPLEAQRVGIGQPPAPGGDNPNPTAPFGWIYLNLNSLVNVGAAAQYPVNNPNIMQNWVSNEMDAHGRFSVGQDAIKLDTACTAGQTNVVFIP